MPKDEVAAACVFVACNQLWLHRTMREIMAGSKCYPKPFKKAITLLNKLLLTTKTAPSASSLAAADPNLCSKDLEARESKERERELSSARKEGR